MQNDQQVKQANLESFNLKMDDPLTIAIPAMPEVTNEDLEAQLFTYIANAPKGSHLSSLADLDDEWARDINPNVADLQGLKDLIAKRLEQENKYAYQNLKVALVSDALIEKLDGTIGQELIDAGVDEVREHNKAQIHAHGYSYEQYLREEGISEQEYEQRILEETKHGLAFNIALDKYIEKEGIAVQENEIVDYLITDDPNEFLEEIKRNNQVPQACLAAVRVKAMRALMASTNFEVAKV